LASCIVEVGKIKKLIAIMAALEVKEFGLYGFALGRRVGLLSGFENTGERRKWRENR
jgi:hypothetical protein